MSYAYFVYFLIPPTHPNGLQALLLLVCKFCVHRVVGTAKKFIGSKLEHQDIGQLFYVWGVQRTPAIQQCMGPLLGSKWGHLLMCWLLIVF